MRFKLILNVEKQVRGTLLPLNYQYELASAIYKILANADQQYSDWLHKNGFMFENWKKFKLKKINKITKICLWYLLNISSKKINLKFFKILIHIKKLSHITTRK